MKAILVQNSFTIFKFYKLKLHRSHGAQFFLPLIIGSENFVFHFGFSCHSSISRNTQSNIRNHPNKHMRLESGRSKKKKRFTKREFAAVAKLKCKKSNARMWIIAHGRTVLCKGIKLFMIKSTNQIGMLFWFSFFSQFAKHSKHK